MSLPDVLNTLKDGQFALFSEENYSGNYVIYGVNTLSEINTFLSKNTVKSTYTKTANLCLWFFTNSKMIRDDYMINSSEIANILRLQENPKTGFTSIRLSYLILDATDLPDFSGDLSIVTTMLCDLYQKLIGNMYPDEIVFFEKN